MLNIGFRSFSCILLTGAFLFAQGGDGLLMVSGTVQDSSGGRLAGTKVALIQEGGHVEQTTTVTDATGSFRFANVSPGPHVVDVNAAGFKQVRQTVRVGARPLPAMRIALSLAERSEEVTVNGEAATVSTEAPENRNSISVSQQTLQSIPVFDMDYIGGVTLVVDGVEANGLGVSASAIQEVKINQDPCIARYR
jgi:hypothetical protein